jgi:TnpA family transposase
MADACPGVSLSTLSRIATWHIRDETYAKALAEVVNHHHRLEFAAHWGDGTTSSSDGQRFKTGGSGEAIGSVNARYRASRLNLVVAAIVLWNTDY